MLVAFNALEVVHKELIEKNERNPLYHNGLTPFRICLWITFGFCGYLLRKFFESYQLFF